MMESQNKPVSGFEIFGLRKFHYSVQEWQNSTFLRCREFTNETQEILPDTKVAVPIQKLNDETNLAAVFNLEISAEEPLVERWNSEQTLWESLWPRPIAVWPRQAEKGMVEIRPQKFFLALSALHEAVKTLEAKLTIHEPILWIIKSGHYNGSLVIAKNKDVGVHVFVAPDEITQKLQGLRPGSQGTRIISEELGRKAVLFISDWTADKPNVMKTPSQQLKGLAARLAADLQSPKCWLLPQPDLDWSLS